MGKTLDLIRRSKFLGRSFIFSAPECSQCATSKLEFSNDVLKNTAQQAKIIKTNLINFSHVLNGCEGAANTLPTKYVKTHFPLTRQLLQCLSLLYGLSSENFSPILLNYTCRDFLLFNLPILSISVGAFSQK